jgi:hypothetical protein
MLGVWYCMVRLKVLVQEILLVELVHDRKASLQTGKLPMFIQKPQADGMERPQIHLMEIE